MPVINPPKLTEIYTNSFNPRYISSGFVRPTPSTGYVLTTDGQGATQYKPGDTSITQRLFVSSISSYSLTVYGKNTFINQGSTILLGSVYFSTLSLNTTNTKNLAIGYNAGVTNQGTNSIAIGSYAGESNQPNNSIILNATGAPLNGSRTNAFYVAPIRQDTTSILPSETVTLPVYWNSQTKELIQGQLYKPDCDILSTFSTVTIADFLSTNILNTRQLITTTINGLPYIPFQVISTFSTVTTSSIEQISSPHNNLKYQPLMDSLIHHFNSFLRLVRRLSAVPW